MRGIAIRLLFVALLLCNFLDPFNGVKAQTTMPENADRKEQVSKSSNLLNGLAEEPRTATGSSFCSSLPSHRVASHRTVRLLPTHGGDPSNKTGRWATASLSNLQKYLPLCQRLIRTASGMGFASPRHYYVIALRRILC